MVVHSLSPNLSLCKILRALKAGCPKMRSHFKFNLALVYMCDMLKTVVTYINRYTLYHICRYSGIAINAIIIGYCDITKVSFLSEAKHINSAWS